jgi:hypothetical protein
MVRAWRALCDLVWFVVLAWKDRHDDPRDEAGFNTPNTGRKE